MKTEIPDHYDKFGRLINVGATVLAAYSNGELKAVKVKALHPIMVRAGYKLQYPSQLVVLPDGHL